jgi:predicted O-methyltransferase YrrM
MPDTDFYTTHPDLEKYAEKHTTGMSDLLHRLYRETNLKTMYPRMLSGHLQGQFLKMISLLMRPKAILEIGTFTGYATINLALGLDEGGVLHTIDSNPESVEIGRKYFAEAGVEEKIKTHIGNALDIVPKLNDDFDLVFIDADKENYLNYYKLLIDKLKPGAMILADNAFWDGRVLDQNTNDRETLGIIKLNDFIQHDERVENVLVPIRDGLMMVRKL